MPSAGLLRQDLGFEGQLYSTWRHNEVVSTALQSINGSNDILPYGRLVKRDSQSSDGYNSFVIPTAAGDVLAGFSMWVDRFGRFSNNVTGYPSKTAMSILTKGYIILRNAGDALFTVDRENKALVFNPLTGEIGDINIATPAIPSGFVVANTSTSFEISPISDVAVGELGIFYVEFASLPKLT